MFKMPVATPGRPGRRDDRRRRAARAASIRPRSRRSRSTPRPGEKAYEELMTEDESTRARDIGEMYAVLPVDRVAARRAGRLPTRRRARRSAPTGRTAPGRWPRRRSVRARRRGVRRGGRLAVRVLVTGAAGFIGRWVVGELLDARPHGPARSTTWSTGDVENLAEFAGQPGFLPFEVGDVRDAAACRRWTAGVDAVAHLAASISVQDSIDDPATTFENDVVGTFNLLEGARAVGRPGPVHEHVHGLRPGDARRTGSTRPTRPSPPRRTPRRSSPARP